MLDRQAERARPRLTGPRMAVGAYFPFDNRVIDGDTRADWPWAMAQWDRVARAGQAVRLVIADQAYSRFDPGNEEGDERTNTMHNKFAACRAVEQLVFGHVYGGGGRIPLGDPGQICRDPLNPDRQVPCMGDQIDAWHELYGEQIDGIYVHAGPRDCTDPAKPGSDQAIPTNYRDYVTRIEEHGYLVYLQAAQYPDNEPDNPWLRNLGADYLNLWEAGVLEYSTHYEALDFCDPEHVEIGVPDWWDPGPSLRYSRVHVINDCRDAETMRRVAELAIGATRGAGTVWITHPRVDRNLGSVYDQLPRYWDQEVMFFFDHYVREKNEKDNKEDKDSKDQKEQKEEKERKEEKDQKDQKEEKERKEEKDQKERKEEKDQKERKDAKDDKDRKEEKDQKDQKDAKDDKERPKELKDGVAKEKDKERGKERDFLTSTAQTFQGFQELSERTADMERRLAALEKGVAEGRTFIRESERPPVGEQTVADPREEETDPEKEEA